MPETKVTIERVFHALGDPTRRAILDLLSRARAAGVLSADEVVQRLSWLVGHLDVEGQDLARTHQIAHEHGRQHARVHIGPRQQ